MTQKRQTFILSLHLLHSGRESGLLICNGGGLTENLIFSLNATVPVFLMMVLGYLLRRTGRIAGEFADKLNTFVFKIALPVQLFEDVVTSNFQELWDGGVVLFCLAATITAVARPCWGLR